MPDGSLLFTEQDAGDGQLVRIDKDDKISTYLENTNRTIGLAYDHQGRLIGTQSRLPRVGVLAPTRMTLADAFEGVPIVFPNDLVVDKQGGVYFTDQLQTRFRPVPAGRTKPLIFYIRPNGTLVKVSEEVASPNGITLSPDEKVLYVANGQTIAAFDVQPDGTLKNFRTHAALVGLNRNAQGQPQGTIPIPLPPQAPAFAGPDKKTLYVVGRGAVYKVAMLAQGVRGRAK
jgi:gluconolactonase